MWNDIETTEDYLHFSVVADTVAELIIESNGNPISIGVSGNWGAGKPSMVKLIGKALQKSDEGKKEKEKDYVFWSSMLGYTKVMMMRGRHFCRWWRIS